MKLVRRRWLRTAGGGLVVGLAIALTLAVVGRGAFGQSILSVVILLWRLPALLSIAAIAGFIEWQQGKIWAAQTCRGAIALSHCHRGAKSTTVVLAPQKESALLSTAMKFLLGAALRAAPNKNFIAQISNAKESRPMGAILFAARSRDLLLQ